MPIATRVSLLSFFVCCQINDIVKGQSPACERPSQNGRASPKRMLPAVAWRLSTGIRLVLPARNQQEIMTESTMPADERE
jgi:hypothetical protein